MAPEAWLGTMNRHSDQYSLALCYAELRTGRWPFPGRGMVEAMLAHLDRAPDLSPLPAAERQVVGRALAKKSGERFGNCTEFVQALQEALIREPGRPPTPISLSPLSCPGAGRAEQSPPVPMSSLAVATLAPAAGPRPGAGRDVPNAPAAPRAASPKWSSAAHRPNRWCVTLGLAVTALATLAGGGLLGWVLPSDARVVIESTNEPESPPPDFLPTVLRRDFGLTVEMRGGRRCGDGRIALEEGQEVEFRIEVQRDAYVGLWTVAPDGTIRQLFPNEFEPDHFVKAGQLRTVPNSQCVIEAEVSPGTEWVWAAASTAPWEELQGRREGPFLVFKLPQERAEAERQLRSLKVKLARKSDGIPVAVAEEVLAYRVSPRRQACQP
jgi:hypothetical protein